jgi:hypothetical protein
MFWLLQICGTMIKSKFKMQIYYLVSVCVFLSSGIVLGALFEKTGEKYYGYFVDSI